jgi:hypothetical protein
MIVSIIPIKNTEIYNVIKQFVLCEVGLPSQNIVHKTLKNVNKLNGIVDKLLI